MRLLRSLGLVLPALAAVPALAAPGCVAPAVEARGIHLDDPLGLVNDVASSGHPLRVYVLPAGGYACDGTTGTITPDILDAEPGMVADAVVDISADVSGDMATAMASIPTGDWTVLVRGKGTDPVSGIRDQIIATGCALVSGLAASETREVRITLLPQHASGMCNDGVLSPDEQCETPGVGDCSATCHTTPIAVNTQLTADTQSHAHAGSALGQRIAIEFDSGATDVGLRILDANGGTITSPGALTRDDTLDNIGMPTAGAQRGGGTAMAADGHFAVGIENYFTMSGAGASDVLVGIYTVNRAVTAVVGARSALAGDQTAPMLAFSGTGALFVAFEDTASSTGLSGRVFAPGASAPSGADAFAIGGTLTGGSSPVVAGLASGFVVAFSAGGDVYFQRFAADGTPMDAAAVAVLDAAAATDAQDQPAIAANADGSFLVAWTEHSVANGDGMGTSIRARAFTAAGAPAGAALVLPSSDASKLGDQSTPSVAAADGRFIVAWAGGGVRARIVSATGTALPNREQPQSASDFLVAASGNAPSATAMGTGGGTASPASWLVVYDDGSDVFARRYPR